MKLWLIRKIDWFDDKIIRHRFHWLCEKIAFCSWWPDNEWIEYKEDNE